MKKAGTKVAAEKKIERKKSRDGVQDLVRANRFARGLCRERPSHFSILMPQKRQRVKSPSGDSPAGDVYRRKREGERERKEAVLGIRKRRGIRRGVWNEPCLIRGAYRN